MGRHDPALTVNGTTLSPSPAGAAADIGAAAIETCRADYQAVTEAASFYEATNGHPPASVAALSQYLRDPVSSGYFSISVSPSSGRVEVTTPGHPASPGDANCRYAGVS
jgi:hypothetical protein